VNRRTRRAERRKAPRGGRAPAAFDPQAALEEGLRLFEAGEWSRAEALLGRVLAAVPGHPDALHLLGLIAHRHGDYGRAVSLIGQAIEGDRSYPVFHLNMSTALMDLGRYGEAEAALRSALALNPRYPEALNNLGNALADTGRTGEAADAYRRALAIRPDYARALVQLASALVDLGEIEEAKEALARGLALNPDSLKGLAIDADISGVASGDAVSAAIERAETRRDLSLEDRIQLHFLKGRTCHDAGDHDRAFAAFEEANRLVGAHLRARNEAFDRNAFVRQVDRLCGLFSPALFAAKAGSGDPSELPVLIVGLPRSGTTLIEQILASHANAHGGGELVVLDGMIEEMTRRTGLKYPRDVATIPAEAFRRFGAEYVARLHALSTGAARVTDKTPLNFVHLGLIALALPGARFIHALRDARDTCLSCYFQNFRERDGMNFAHDLTDLSTFHREHLRLMKHWRRVLPLSILEVRYEDLVARQEEETRRIVAFCGLAWDPRCLDFHRTERVVRTASRTQVRRAMYTTSVERWRPYERHLGPLLEALGEAGGTRAR
jgi:tetratricopeptide (TPR) repeat protein